jgi:hypothetical protein
VSSIALVKRDQNQASKLWPVPSIKDKNFENMDKKLRHLRFQKNYPNFLSIDERGQGFEE